ncbi:sushi, von Willebrand factor type A, EGF and pentraxin domain-containing protein 1-like [Branchiostoma floridae]|uniref:Sushi, von Willebrand factor type A, EGF and pentraxin domain-containing protein 1-like n=1 Tax=Branchiostoma floridae TaxID=7739 RepID=A0A9J7M8L1_BRAFL|nr:sushi, von Willebrand factor type A, EGF and pentraxin domain-containing protein 1-like [Branchiostoma floridae]
MIWVPNEAPTCQDTQAPQLTCPTGIETIRAAEGEMTAMVTWEEPTATDNSGEEIITPVQTTEIEKDKHHPAGYYDIRYKATDSSGQSAECIFGKRVEALTCPAYPVPENGEGITGCTDAAFGQFCKISCDPGYDLQGASTARCIASEVGVDEGEWDQENASCIVRTCPAMYSPNHGSINDECDGQKVPFGTECHFSCDEGYWLTGQETNICSVEGRWEHPTPFCKAKTCHSSELPIPTNGVKSSCPNEEEYYGTTCVLSCLTGYLPREHAQVTCENSEDPTRGVWDDDKFSSCEIVTCQAPEKPGNGSIERCQYDGENTDLTTDQKYSTVCSMACDDGFTVTGGTLSRTCTEMATWDGSELQCEDITSPQLYCPDDQLYFTEQRRTSHDPDWSWEPVEATDRGLAIYAALSKINAQVVTDRPQTLSEGVHVLEYEAVDGAGLVSTCTFKVTVQVTRCPVLLPPSPPFGQIDLVHGEVSCSSAVYGSQCRQSCMSGYHLTDTNDALLNCTRNSDSTTIGVWEGTLGKCEQVFCSASFSLTNGQVTPSECGNSTSLPYSTLCRFSCDNGFLVQGPIFRQCLSDGTWSDLRNTSCKDQEPPQFTVPCPQYIDANARSGTTAEVSYTEPMATDNSGNVTILKSPANLSPDSTFPEGTTRITYTAMDASSLARQCVVYIRVNVLRCQRLPAPLWGSYDSCPVDSPLGSSCSFRCNEGYVLNGPGTHTCELDEGLGTGFWSGNETTCEAITCPAIQTKADVIKSGCFSEPPQTERYGTTCQFYCPYGYGGVGESKARCLANSSWSGDPEEFSCEGLYLNSLFPCILFCCPSSIRVPLLLKRTCSPLKASTEYRTVPTTCTSNPSYLDTCIHTCRRSGYRLQPPGHEFTTCLGNGQWTRDTSNLTCIDIEPPSFIYCPRDITVYADRGDTGALVNWTLPVAEDNSGENPTLTWNICPCVLPVGEYDVVYVATDDAGNQQTCEFTVKVDVRRCQRLHPPVHAHFTSRTCDNSYGTTCQVACSTGYQLSGSSNATCEFDGTIMYWERESQPYCSIATCSGLTLPENGDLYPSFCTTMPTYGTTCQYFCRNGYSLHPDVEALTCTSSGTWNGYSTTPNCRDVTSPHLLSCPGPQSGVLEGTNPTVTISWEVPTAVDNAPGQLRVVTTPAGIVPPHNFSQDTEVIYTFYDAANNSAECRFQIYIQDELVPVVRSCPDDIAQTTTSADTLVSWDPPVFKELTNDALIIVPDPATFSSSSFTLGEHFVTYTATNPDNGKSAVCSFRVTLTAIQCTDLNAPQNGALSCGDWGDRKTCTLLCNDAFDIPRGQSGERLYLCRNDGIWTPHDNVPDCTAGRNPRVNQLPSELQYYSGDCTDQTTKDNIAAAFAQLVTDSGFCTVADGCSVDGVEVTCGPISATGKRRRRRSTPTHVITIKFNFQVDLSIPPDDVLAEDDWYASEEKLKEIANNFATILESHGESLNVSGLLTEINATSFWHDDLSFLACDYGYEPNYASLKCVGCGTGRYYDGEQDDCVSCPVGTYQTQFGQTSCIPCPEGFTTIREEARNLTKCLPMCPLGQYSTTGVEPCSPCPKDTYQPMNGSTQCVPCPNDTRTASVGATSVDSCHEPCAAGSFSLTGVHPCQPCTKGRYQPSTGKTACLPCDPHLTTVTVGSTNIEQCKDPCRNIICENGGTCTFTSGNTSCSCLTGFEGERCDNNIDDCSSQPCLNNATCEDGVNNYTCSCADGYSGAECAVNVDECESSPCQNNGTCEDRVNGYTCDCYTGYEGPHCEEESDWCADNPCRNGGTCISSAQIANIVCQCGDGFHGNTCDIDVDECLSQPCQNHGTCIDMINGYQCICYPGYSGSECQTDIDLCEDNPCHNNGTCVDLGLGFKCLCGENRGGELCEDEADACTRQPCQNGGTCTFSEDGSYNCTCGPGYAGFHCEDNIDECASQPCSNGGTCHDGHNGFSCECPDGLAGTTCVDVDDRCAPSPCANNGTCTAQENGSIKCVCSAGYGGDTCDQQLSSCVDNQCAHGATCQEEDSSYSCVCPQGYTGFFCDSPIDNCASEPCFNNAVCESTNSSYTCTCPVGLEGEQCTNDTDECSTFPCLNNGTCINSFGSYECICDDGYAGEACEVDVDECLSIPCLNGGTCADSVNGYSCECAPGYGGEDCGEDADECLSSSCLHGAICSDVFNGFTCHCTPGWEGDTCEINKDECAASPCQDNGTCVDLVNDYRCECPAGYSGKNCSVRTVSCSSQPCNNSGTCEEREDGGIHCTCTEGWTGTYCQINQDDCTPNPCRNGGNCKDLLNGYRCECTPAFTGSDCEEDVDECLGHDCRNGATCEDRLGHYICRCAKGYEGARCELETNECDPNPCQNGATCIDEVANFYCSCSAGFQGEICQENIDDCETSSCENGGVCIDGIDSFSCLCKDGYSGFNCSEDVDECASGPCGDNAVCHDGIGTYTCTCKPGYTGRDCETELSPDYDLHFPGSSTSDYSILPYGIQESLKVLRMGAWIRSSQTRGTVISYAVQSGDNFEHAFSLSNPGNVVVTIGGEPVTTNVRVDDYEWHHIAVKWLNRGTLVVYKDGDVAFDTRDVQVDYVIPPGGYIVLGQMQTQSGGGFLVEDAFAGDISQLYIWKQPLSITERMEMSSSCGYVPTESIRAWPDFRWSIYGQVAEQVPSLCDVLTV